MRAPLFVLGLVAASLAILAVAVYALDDETLFVPSPEITVDQLLRAASRDRIAAVRNMLSRDARNATSDRDIGRVSMVFRERVGRVLTTTREAFRHRGDTLLVRLSVDGERGDPDLLVRMVREEGVWAATHLEDVLPAGGAVRRADR